MDLKEEYMSNDRDYLIDVDYYFDFFTLDKKVTTEQICKKIKDNIEKAKEGATIMNSDWKTVHRTFFWLDEEYLLVALQLHKL